MSNEGNNYESAAGDLAGREFSYSQSNQSQENQEEFKPTSLGKARGFENERDDEPALLPGYHEIWKENFPSKGIFYPEGMRFFVRAAAVKEIRHFSTINDQDPFSVDEALNEITKNCLMIRMPGKQASFKDLCEEDRIHIIMTIRELTFAKGENNLGLMVTCNDCGHDNEITIGKDSFEANVPDEKLMKYYDPETKKFIVQTKSSGIIELRAPSIGIMQEVTKYIKKAQQEGTTAKIDQSFLKTLPYMVQDWRGLNDTRIKQLEVEFMQWGTTKYTTFNALAEMAKVGVKDQLSKECEKCGTEVRTNISFPGGIKSLFLVSDISGELL
jgi:hypothetical protein